MGKIFGSIKHLIAPSNKNNFRARLLHRDLLTLYLVFAVLFVSLSKNTGSFSNVLGYATDITTQKLLEFTNIERKNHSLSTLTYNQKLATAAQKKAEDMFARNYWAHYGPDGKTPWSFMYEQDYQYEYAGENLAKNFLFSKNVVDAWMNSPSHRENLLRSEYTEVGFAIVNGVLNGEQTTLVVQMFGKPLGNDVATESLESPKNEQVIADLAGVQAENKITTTPKLSYNVFWFFVLFLSFALIADMYFAVKFNIVRFHGKNAVHLVFIIFISIGVILFITKGNIL